jgi:hypothetical protein
MLYYSTLLFVSNIIHSSYVCWYVGEYVLLGLLSTSLIHHSKYYDSFPGKKLVHLADIAFVHIVVITGFYESIRMLYISDLTNYLASYYIIQLFGLMCGMTSFYLEDYLTLQNINWKNLHILFHITGSISGHLLCLEYANTYTKICV